MDVELRRHRLVNPVEELPKLAGAVARVTFSEDGAGPDFQGGEERGGPMSHVVVGAPLNLPRAQGQQRLGAVERLDLGLLVAQRTRARSGGSR